jgi:hypothetical protein
MHYSNSREEAMVEKSVEVALYGMTEKDVTQLQKAFAQVPLEVRLEKFSFEIDDREDKQDQEEESYKVVFKYAPKDDSLDVHKEIMFMIFGAHWQRILSSMENG